MENADGTTSSTIITTAQIDSGLQKLNVEFTALDKFINYAETKLIQELPKIKLALEVEILSGKTELKDFRNNIKSMINSGEVIPIGKANEYIEVNPSETWGIETFQFSGTVSEVTSRLNEAKKEVSKKYEALTGIRAIFSEFGNNIAWDLSNASRPNGISESTTPEEYQAYVALKELSVANSVANEMITKGALFKPEGQRTELEKSVIQTRIKETNELLAIMIKQRELGILVARDELNKFYPGLVTRKNDLVEVLERLKSDPLATNEKIAEYETLISYTENQIVTLQNRVEGRTYSNDGGITWHDGESEAINDYLEELQQLTPESATVEVKTLIDQISENIDQDFSQYQNTTRLAELNAGLLNAQEYLKNATEKAKEWQASAILDAQRNIANTHDYWNQQIERVKEGIAFETREIMSRFDVSQEQAQSQAESKYGGIIENLEVKKIQAIETATSTLDVVSNESLSTYIEKMGINQVEEKIKFIQEEIKSLSDTGIELKSDE